MSKFKWQITENLRIANQLINEAKAEIAEAKNFDAMYTSHRKLAEDDRRSAQNNQLLANEYFQDALVYEQLALEHLGLKHDSLLKAAEKTQEANDHVLLTKNMAEENKF
jgi:hypothetical protein